MEGMVRSNNSRSRASTRRQFLKYGTAGGSVLLAGCLGGGGGGGGQSPTKQFSVFDPLTSGAAPTERHLNPWNPSQTGCWHPGAAIMDRLAVYSPTKNEAYPLIAESWEKTSDTVLEVTLSDQWTWHNGDPFVAQDYVMEQQIELEILRASAEDGKRAHQVMKGIEAVDDQHIRIQLHDPLTDIFAVQNTIGSYHGNLGRGVFTKHDDAKWSDWHKRLRNTSGKEKTAVIEEITTATYPSLTSDTAMGHGPFQLKDVGDDIVVMETYDDHPNADNINFDEFTINLFSQNKPTQPYTTGQVDAAHKGFPLPKDQRKQLPDNHTLFREGRSTNKLFAFNCGHEINDYDSPFESVNVRKAVCHVFDRQQVSSLLQGVNQLFKWPVCRVPGTTLANKKDHSSVQFVNDNLTMYGTNDTKRATSLLRQDGYERNGKGNWLTPDGKRFEIKIMNGAERPDIQVLKKNLKDFGIDVTQQQVDDATFDENRTNGHYDMMPDGSSANGITALWALDLVSDWIQSITHFSPETDIPMPIGDSSGSSGTKTINVADHIRKWQVTGNSKFSHELMWWWNQTLPEAEMMYQPDAGAYNAKNWTLDAKAGIKNGVDDALYIAPKMPDGSLRYTGT